MSAKNLDACSVGDALLHMRNAMLLAAVCGCVASCQRPADPLAEAPVFYARPVVQEPPPPPQVPPRRPTLEDFATFAGSSSVMFQGDNVELDAEARAILDRQAEWLRRNPQVTASLQGHADLYGGRERQFAIGEMRASAMRRYLVARGVQPDRLEVTSFGKQRPIAAALDEASQQRNRRGETVLRGVAGVTDSREED